MQDPCFRIGPDGYPYQVPLSMCAPENQYQQWTPSTITSPSQPGYCLQSILSTKQARFEPCDGGLDQQWYLKPRTYPGVPDSFGSVQVYSYSHGLCLNVKDAPTYQEVQPDLFCERVPWVTEVNLDYCWAEHTEFQLVPWPGKYYVPGLRTKSITFRLRPTFTCYYDGITPPADTMPHTLDNGSCVDANVTGDRVLRVFWCHDDTRQQFQSTW